jgi:hypothetical protein
MRQGRPSTAAPSPTPSWGHLHAHDWQLRFSLFGATTIPIGTGAGDVPYDRAARTNAASMVARPADGAMFAVNYVTAIAGADFAYVSHGFTAQGAATLLQ